jgi:hypothetical protein
MPPIDYNYMIIKKKRIRKISNSFPLIKNGQEVCFGVSDIGRFTDKLKEIGFTDLDAGCSVLPKGIFGSTSMFNAEGKYDKRNDLPMETAYRETEWHWKQWRGRGETEEMSKTVYVPYKRYPRDFVTPPSIEFVVSLKTDGAKIIRSPLIKYSTETEQTAIHIVNLLLEIFGECQVFSNNLEEMIKIPVLKLNWRVLPQGEMPWTKLKGELSPFFNKIGLGKKIAVENRIETINSYGANFCAVGEAGFSGYVVFGFPNKKVFLMESMFYGNATYVFGDDWKVLSKKTKAEILTNSLQQDRLIHRENWEKKVGEVLKKI